MTFLAAKIGLRHPVQASLWSHQREVSTATAPHSRNLAIPRRGHVLTTVSEAYGRPVRTAVSVLAEAFRHDKWVMVHRTWLARRISEPGAWVDRRPADSLAWALVSAWLAGLASGRVTPGTGFVEGTGWFFAGVAGGNPTTLVPRHARMQVDNALAQCRDPAGYRELLPYVLDPHGPGSRLSIRRDSATQSTRDRKRAEGVYYTPADVAAYMVRQCLDGVRGHPRPPVVFDPACGTGVFLRASLETLKAAAPDQSARLLAETLVYGVDVDPWALDAAAFVLLSDCLSDGEEMDVSPLLLWHRLRLNLACVDALRLDPARVGEQGQNGIENRIVEELAAGRLPEPCGGEPFGGRVPLSQLFARTQRERLVIVGNPPYSTLGARSDFAVLGKLFATLGKKVGPRSEIYPLFIEQMVRLAPPSRAAGTLVLPLSLASNVGNQFVETRSLIEKTPGRWRFAFFDREPHALFGEDVKTRNTVLFWHRDEQEHETRIEAGPLRKWRGDSRAAMFASIRFTPVARAIRVGIPKIDGVCQARAFEALTGRWDRFDQVCTDFRRMPLARVLKNDRHTVFVGATAYNFLNVFLNPPQDVLAQAPALSEHPLHAIDFSAREDAAAVFALFSSHIAYWWWRVSQDGFHVTARFLAGFPFGTDALNGATRATLAACGEKLWSLIRTDPIVSLNRGRTSLAYSPNGFDDVRCEIDCALATLAGLEPAFVAELQEFTAYTIRAEFGGVRST